MGQRPKGSNIVVIDDTHRLVFVHIPKCGGTSIRAALSAFDSLQGEFAKKGVHPILGPIFFGHLPLAFVERHYPSQWEKLLTYESLAVARDPFERFSSATIQRLKEFRGEIDLKITTSMALNEAHKTIQWLSRRGTFCDMEYIHFSRQIDYVELEGRRMVTNIFAIEHLAALATVLETRYGLHLDPERRENATFASDNRLLARLRVAKPVYKRLTSWTFRERMLVLMRRLRLHTPTSLYEAFRRDSQIRDFVEDYYADDFALHRAARAEPYGLSSRPSLATV
jgi:hypothetical protein